MNIETNKTYRSQLIANTELHAGGLFFCIIYCRCLTFKNDGQVILTREIVDPFRPMDPIDVKHIENYNFTGKYYINDRGYLICEFEDIFTTLTGMYTLKDPDMIVFSAFEKRSGITWSEIYKLT